MLGIVFHLHRSLHPIRLHLDREVVVVVGAGVVEVVAVAAGVVQHSHVETIHLGVQV